MIILLLDLSGSMDELVGMSGKTRRNMLEQALANLLPRHPGVLVYIFGTDVRRLSEPQAGLPETMGGTNLAKALRTLQAEHPSHVVVISDGEPQDERGALNAAMMLSCKISTIYCGDEANSQAIAFLNKLRLCSRGGQIGRSNVTSLAAPEETAKQIEQVLRLEGPR
jgi:hypothetical protein